MHREDTIKNKFIQMLRTAMLKRSNNIITRNLEYLKEKLSQKDKVEYRNEHIIDTFIDEYWFINCPGHLSIFQQHQQVQRLFHELMM